MNIDYKYFAGTKDPIEIINKYRMRGYGTWLSNKERKQYTRYSSTVDFWKSLFIISKNKKSIVYDGPLCIQHPLYKPRLYNENHYLNVMPSSLEYTNNTSSIIKYADNNAFIASLGNNTHILSSRIHNLCCINDTGHIEPIKKHIIESYYENLS
jgi:hypothetical protein